MLSKDLEAHLIEISSQVARRDWETIRGLLHDVLPRSMQTPPDRRRRWADRPEPEMARWEAAARERIQEVLNQLMLDELIPTALREAEEVRSVAAYVDQAADTIRAVAATARTYDGRPYDQGGQLPPGAGVAENRTGEAELVIPPPTDR